jgi:hypothetical protein
MPQLRDLRSFLHDADTAAAAGDYAAAERLLREASTLQEAQLGPLHPDLANTLNNLGVVCDIVDKPADAERCYRRAFAIANAALAPDHPFVATSRKNLEGFCRARGIPVEPTPPAPMTVVDTEPAITAVMGPPSEEAIDSAWRRTLAIGAIAAIGSVVMFMAIRPWFRSDTRAESSSGSAPQSRPASSGTASSPKGPAKPPAARTASAPTTSEPGTAPREPDPDGPTPSAPVGRAGSVTLVDASLCRSLSTGAATWRCTPPSVPVGAGPLLFYTRVTSTRDTTIQHRWYRGATLRQAVMLRVRANPGEGYRTYSRNTVHEGIAGDWRVEVRTQDGALLHEERFVVR